MSEPFTYQISDLDQIVTDAGYAYTELGDIEEVAEQLQEMLLSEHPALNNMGLASARDRRRRRQATVDAAARGDSLTKTGTALARGWQQGKSGWRRKAENIRRARRARSVVP